MTGVTSRPHAGQRRKPPHERRAEILATAASIAVSEGLHHVTARRVADALGVFPGLVSHYFITADDLVAAAFAHAAEDERDEVFGHAQTAGEPVEQIQRLLTEWLRADRDAISLLWLDAWQASRRRPALLAEVTRQMNKDYDRLRPIIEAGVAIGQFRLSDPGAAGLRIMALTDAMCIQAAIRTTIDYSHVREMVISGAERELGLAPGTLDGSRIRS